MYTCVLRCIWREPLTHPSAQRGGVAAVGRRPQRRRVASASGGHWSRRLETVRAPRPQLLRLRRAKTRFGHGVRTRARTSASAQTSHPRGGSSRHVTALIEVRWASLSCQPGTPSRACVSSIDREPLALFAAASTLQLGSPKAGRLRPKPPRHRSPIGRKQPQSMWSKRIESKPQPQNAVQLLPRTWSKPARVGAAPVHTG